jgi:hypothetical protein
MVRSCCIVGCAQRQNKAKNISLHRISSFPDKKKKTMDKCKKLSIKLAYFGYPV